MIVRNISSKIVNIGTKMILPDNEISITDEEAKIPALVAMKRVGLITMIDTSHKEEATKKVCVGKTEQDAEEIINNDIIFENAVKRVTKKKKIE